MLLIIAAVLPAAYLMLKVYQSDRLEREPAWMLISLVLLGLVSTTLAGLAEQLGERILMSVTEAETVPYNALFYFLVVGPAEEFFKYLTMRWRTWRNPEFDCQYDGVVYAVFAALGFALWENIGYVMMYGIETALARALTAVPGHACFGVFMGVWYGIAKRYDLRVFTDAQSGIATLKDLSSGLARSRRARWLCVIIPALLHGCYDFIASMESEIFVLVFLVFVLTMFIVSLRIVKRQSRRDDYM